MSQTPAQLDDVRLEFTLADQRRLRLRPICPADKEKLRAALASQSSGTRYRRFLSDKRDLSDKELRYLTEVDQQHHLALVIVRLDEAGEECEGVCSARYVELTDEPGVAEPALAVDDDYQGLGIGRSVFEHLIACARRRGIHTFHCELLADNRRMVRILDDIAPAATRSLEGAVLVMRFELEPIVLRRSFAELKNVPRTA